MLESCYYYYIVCLAYKLEYGSSYECNQHLLNENNDETIEYCTVYGYWNSINGYYSLTWSHGQGVCLSLNYTVAVIKTQAEQAFLYEHAYILLVYTQSLITRTIKIIKIITTKTALTLKPKIIKMLIILIILLILLLTIMKTIIVALLKKQ